MSLTVPGVSIPGQAAPGVAVPGRPAAPATAATWQFTGLERLYYLQYLDPDGHTLSPASGQAYTAGTITVTGQPYPLSDPPADGRWITY